MVVDEKSGPKQTRAVTRQRARLFSVMDSKWVRCLDSWKHYTKSKKGDNSAKMLDRVMGLDGMMMSIDPEDMCEVSSQYLQ